MNSADLTAQVEFRGSTSLGAAAHLRFALGPASLEGVQPNDDDIDRRKLLRQLPSWGPAWDAAIEFGIDVTMLEENLKRSMEERLAESVRMTRFAAELEAARERLYGPGK